MARHTNNTVGLPRAHSTISLPSHPHFNSNALEKPPPTSRLPKPQSRFPINATGKPTPARQATATVVDAMATSSTEAYRMALQYIKALFVQEQYRKCIQVCRDALKIAAGDAQSQLQRLYISFYLGLSYDAIARVMHHNSVAKLPAFDSAEQHFIEALGGLPSSDQAREMCTRTATPMQVDPFFEDTRSQYSVRSQLPDYHPHERAPSRASSMWFSSPPQFDGECIPSSPAQTASELDDIESNASFDLATPKGLQRDYSQMSLLESSPLQKRVSMTSIKSLPLQRQKSVRGLMRPIRPGSPAKAFHIPPQLPYSGSDARRRSMLPRLSTSEQTSTRPASSYLAYAIPQSPDVRSPVSPVSPVSHAGSDRFSEDTPVSPLSPQTPYQPPPHAAYPESVCSTSIIQEEPEDRFDEPAFLRVTDHVNAMRSQIESHLALLYNAKEQLYQLQAEKKAAAEARLGAEMPHAARDSGKYFFSSPAPSRDRSPERKQIQQSRSYWSFVPEDVKVDEKKRWIEAGRARNWKRKRFDPTKYRDLCEQALAEL